VRTSRALVAVSAAQLAVQVVANAVAIRRRRHYDFVPLGMRGSPDTVARDSLLMGTSYSAPVVMLVTQAAATAALRRAPTPVAGRALGFLGWAMIGGYLGERMVQRRLMAGEWDPVETPLAAAGLGGAAVMAWLGLGRTPR
jgi:hypothetical protein